MIVLLYKDFVIVGGGVEYGNYFTVRSATGMTRLNQRKILWIIREIKKVLSFNDKTHMSLDFKNGETPEETLWRKLPEEMIFK